MTKQKIITDADLKNHKTTMPKSDKSKTIVMDETTQPKPFDWKKIESDVKPKKSRSATNK